MFPCRGGVGRRRSMGRRGEMELDHPKRLENKRRPAGAWGANPGLKRRGRDGGLRRNLANCGGNGKYRERLCCGKGNRGPPRVQSSPKGRAGRQTKIVICAEGKSELRNQEGKLDFPFDSLSGCYRALQSCKLALFLGGKAEIFNSQV